MIDKIEKHKIFYKRVKEKINKVRKLERLN